jgi:hypothetical protein
MRFWDMTIDEIRCVIYGQHQRMKFQAQLAYMIPQLIGIALSDIPYPQPQEAFPGLLEAPQQKQNWQVMRERVLTHANDYKRNRGDKIDA